MKDAATSNDPLAVLAGIDGRDAESMNAGYTKQADRYGAALGRLFRDRASCEVCYMTLCLLNAIREADFFDLKLEPVTRDIAHRTLDAARFAFTTYSEAYDAIRDMLVQGTPADLVMQGIDAILDVDDTTSYGPETTTFKVASTGTYRFYVHDYTNKEYPSSRAMARSGAVVRVYKGTEKIAEVSVPGGAGIYWNVFTITDGVFKLTNYIN